MIGDPIYYRRQYKYQLSRGFRVDLNMFLHFPPMEYDVLNDFVYLTKDGIMNFHFGYCWDGASGPTFDDRYNARTGLIHDGGCQLIREGLLPMSYRDYFDHLLEIVGKSDGMCSFRAWYYRQGVEHSGGKYACKGYDPYPELVAPEGTTERPDYPKGE